MISAMTRRGAMFYALLGLAAHAGGGAAGADMVLTGAGLAQGLNLTTFATNFPTTGSLGPLGITFTPSGGVLVSDQLGNVRLFPTDVDGQNAASAAVGHNYGNNNSEGLTHLGSNIYMGQFNAGRVVQIHPDGTFDQTIISNLPTVGIVSDPAYGLLFASTRGDNQVYEIDPIAKTSTLFKNVSNPDGLSVSPDGQTLYVAATGSGHVLGYNIQSKALTFDSGAISGGIDGTAAGAGTFSNDLFVNLNNGSLVEINLTTLTQTVIATGGSRGDFVTVDPSNSSLLITQTDRILRLNGASFVPEPSSLALISLGGLGLLGWAHRRRARG